MIAQWKSAQSDNHFGSVKMDRSTVKILVFLATLCLVRSNDDDAPKVKTPLGGIQGYYKISEYGRPYEAYEGVPYAQPPIGKLRFKPPHPITAWPGEIQATKMSHVCLQYMHMPDYMSGDRVLGSEDCLYLNVYIPQREGDATSLPVLFYIHGGAFTHGSGGEFGAKYIMDKDVILVTVNYRLGPLGFLSTEDEIVPGNMGLKDQSIALRWVHDNIEYFGGDPNRITLVGLSAGGVSVHYHYFSSLSAGLFHNGMSLSGTVLNCWAQTENSLEKAKRLGALMGCPTESTKEMIKCLKYRPARPMVQAVQDFMPWLYNPYTPFGPVVEKSKDKPFIDRPPVEMLHEGKVLDVPWITSITSDEGLYPVAEFAANEKLLQELNENWESIAPHLLDFNYTITPKLRAETSRNIKKHYMGSNPINRQNVKPITKMVGDRLFVVDAEKAARMQAKVNKSPVWFYYYSYRAADSLSDIVSGTKENFGVSHADDAYLVLENSRIDPTTTESDRAMQRDLLHIWESFAEKSVPDLTPEWKNIDPSQKDLHYLHISGPNKFKMSSIANLGDKQFWKKINFDENILKTDTQKDEL